MKEVREIREQLTLEEKCALLSGASVFQTRAFKKKNIPAIWLSDGPHGLRKQAGPSDHLGLNPSVEATCFPTAAAVANSWDETLGEQVGRALGEEAAVQGVHVLLGPGLNMKRNPLCGRNFEYFSEDPYLAGKMAAAYIRGIQSNGVAACPKHFAVNDQETRRMASDSIVDERTLREVYLTGFEIAVKEGKPKCIMSSYNRINGVYANENKHLLTDILKKDWGYQGAVVTDWGGSNDHALGVAAGSTLEMPAPGGDSVRELMAAVKSGKIKESDVDARVDEMLELISSTQSAIERGGRQAVIKNGEANLPEEMKEKHHALAAHAAAESLTLLKNEGGVLPLKETDKVALIGDFAENPRYQGEGSSMVHVTALDNLRESMEQSKLNVIGYAKGFDRLGSEEETLAKEAEELAGRADVTVLCLGLDEVQESEGLDRSGMRIRENQVQLLKRLRRCSRQVVVVLFSGSSVETPWRSDCDAILYACLCGQAGAKAVADALDGTINPGGKLAETWIEHYEDTPSLHHFAGKKRTVEYREALYIGYRYYQKAKVPVVFPFGYGLSYTTFSYTDLEVTEKQVSFLLKNTGDREGTEISQIYVSAPGTEVFVPERELKGFAKTTLKAGEQRRVTIVLDDKAFRYWNVKTNRWEQEAGTYQISVGISSQDMVLSDQIELAGSGADAPYDRSRLPHYESGQVQNVDEAEFAYLLGHPVPDGRPDISRNMTLGEMNHGRSPLGWLIWAVLNGMLNCSLKKGQPDLNLLFQLNMPLRGLAKMTSGMISMGMVDGIVLELKGFWFIGLIKILVEFIKNMVLNLKFEGRMKES